MGNEQWVALAVDVRRELRPWGDLADVVDRLLGQRVVGGASAVSLCLDQLPGAQKNEERRLFFGPRPPKSLRIEPLGDECQRCVVRAARRQGGSPEVVAPALGPQTVLPCGAQAALPLRYQGSDLGSLVLWSEPGRKRLPQDFPHYCAAAQEIAYQLKRFELRSLIRSRLHRDLACLGTSDALLPIDEFIEKASESKLPALVVGEPGSEVDFVAHALHFAGPCHAGSLVQVRCATVDPAIAREELQLLLERSRGGTLFLSVLEDLEYRQQAVLAEILETAAGDSSAVPPPRVVASCHREPEELVRAGRLCRHLHSAVDYLRLAIPTLRQRKEDIALLADHFLRRYSPSEVPRRMSEAALALLETYGWPENVSEMERAMARLAVMSGGETIGVEELEAYQPQLVQRLRQSPQNVLVEMLLSGRHKGGEEQDPPFDFHLLRLAESLFRGELSRFDGFHPGLQRSMSYLSEHYQEDLSLAMVARHACLSSSHLSTLLHQHLGASYKRLVTMTRLVEAVHLLTESPNLSITEVATAVGFRELRQCERAFRKVLGCPPQQYRRRALGPG